MNDGSDAIRGRGASGNPANRFERLAYEPDPDAVDLDAPAPTTQFFRDTSRSIIATNESPDVGFNASINPYRGCEHGCVYCLAGDTLILMADGTTRRLQDIQVGNTIYGTVRDGWYHRYVKTEVLAHWSVEKPAFRLTLEDGTTLITGPDHRFLTERGWKFVTCGKRSDGQRPYLTMSNKLMGIGTFAAPPTENLDYKQGYLCGLIRGDGLLGSYTYERRSRVQGNTLQAKQHQFRLALVDFEALQRAIRYLLDFEVAVQEFVFQKAFAARKELAGIRTHARKKVERVREIIAWPAAPTDDWCKGYLAGIFDAEGSYSTGIMRIPNTDRTIVLWIKRCLKRFGFRCQIESRVFETRRPQQVVRIRGGLQEHLRFFHIVGNTISRKRNIAGQAVKSSARLRVQSIEPLGVTLPLFDITTGTGDFIANGVVSHNCYARPYHEYLGFSAGLDFETKIMIKEDAPALLRKELMSKRWQPQVLGISGVTDCYQPIERRLQLTRRCLEVLAEFRNPVAIVTKNGLVARDADVLSELARYNAAVVFLSITTLDADLTGILEPRASRPPARLAALETLSAAGIPVGVMVAPIIPGLTDHEMPAILEAAFRAGARSAGYVALRLPLGVAALFENWLTQHFPERKDKVLGRIRDMRGGRLNDANFGSRMRGQGPIADLIKDMFALACRKAGIVGRGLQLSTAAFRRPGQQRGLFD